MRWGFCATTVLLACLASARYAEADVSYMVSLANPERHLVRVTMQIPAGRDSHELQLPVWNALYEVRDFSKYTTWIRAETATGQPLPLTQINKSRWKVTGAAMILGLMAHN
jgi:predicted metalloprotease with PDZ domain